VTRPVELPPSPARARVTRYLLASGTSAGAALFTLLVGAGAWAQAPSGPAPPAVLVAAAEMRDVTPGAEFVGRVHAIDKVELRARVSGFLGERAFSDGDEVREGQVLFRIDPAPLEAVVAQRRASVSAAQATVALAELQAERGRDLVRTRALPQAQQDEREANVARGRADLELALAALREAEINLSYTEIRSPIAGRVGEAAVSPGNLVGPDAGVLATVVRQDPIRVGFTVTQRELIRVRRERGDATDPSHAVVRLRLADGSPYEEPGQLDFLGVVADARTDSIAVRAVFPNPRRILADGLSVRVVLEATEAERALVIPQAAVSVDQAGSYVLTVDAENKVVPRRVRAEYRRDGTAVVRQGLTHGERVIVQGQARVRPGLTVAPSPMPGAGG
jgi:membrane fusion protein (multidrug efflux system)